MGRTSRKRLFIGLLAVTCFLLMGFLASLWLVPYVGLQTISPLAPWIWGAVVVVLMVLTGWCVLGLVLNIWLGRPVVFTHRLRGLTVKLFLPLMTLVGRVLGMSKSRVRNSFVSVNNEMVLSEAGKYRPDEILLLMPHCLQNSRCARRLTYDINNCKRCGECPIAGLLDLHDKYGVHLAIATGGTVARRIVVQKRPRIIVAVACERDLTSGIKDTYPLPVYGVFNERPHGPCLDTTVALEDVEKALLRFLDPEFYPGKGDPSVRGETISTAAGAGRSVDRAAEPDTTRMAAKPANKA